MPALLLLILWPLAEAFVAFKVAEAIGVGLTIALLIISWPIGIALMRAEGRGALRRFTQAEGEGRPPGRAALDGMLVLLGGLLLIVPGFITDVIGLVLLVPPIRARAGSLAVRNFQSRLVAAAARFGGPTAAQRPTGPAYDVDSTASDVKRPQIPSR